MTRRARAAAASLGFAIVLSATAAEEPARIPEYVPQQRVPAALEPYLRHVSPGDDAFPEEKAAAEMGERLGQLSALLKESPDRAREVGSLLLAPDFKGALGPVTDAPSAGGPLLTVTRAAAFATEGARDRGSFEAELVALASDFDRITVAEFLITSIAVKDRLVWTDVRYDLVGPGKQQWRVERVGRWRMAWRRGPDGAWRVAQWSALAETRSRAAAPVFSEVTEAAFGSIPSFRPQLGRGLDAWLVNLDGVFMPGGMGHHGVSVADVDGDGLDDIHVAQPAALPNRLFRNKGDGTFEDITEAAGVGFLDSTSQALFADVDNDGDQDLVLVMRSGLLLLLNDGKGRFTPVKDAFRFKLRGAPTSVAMADYDRDGFLDIYVCTYAYFIGASEDKAGQPTPYHDAKNGPPDALLHNDGHGHFTDVTDDVGLDNNDRFSFAAAWADYDEDGWPDLLVANDFGRKNLYHNEGRKNGKVTFKDVAAQAGVEDYGAGMSATWADYDNDGHLDIYTGNMWTAAGLRVTSEPGFMPEAPAEIREIYKRHARGNSLFRNKGDGTFEDVTLAARAEFGRWAWASDAIDFDNDGWEDLYVVNGMFTRDPDEQDVDLDSFFWRQVVSRSPLTHQRGTPFDDAWRVTNRLLVAHGSQARHERNVFLRNDGHGGFDEVSGSVGLDLDQDGRSFAVTDYDLDGDPDLIVMAPRSAPELRAFRNDFAETNAALALRLAGTKSNRDAVGACVTVETDQVKRTKIVQAGSGFISQHSKELLFGLGKSQRVVKLTIRWPSGTTQTLAAVPINERVWVTEGSDTLRSEPFRPKSVPATAATIPTTAEAAAAGSGTWLYRPFPAPDFKLKDLNGVERGLAGVRGRPVVLLLWASTAPASRAALEALARQGPALSAAGATLLALSVDRSADAAQVRAAAQRSGVPVMIVGELTAGAYTIANRYIFDRRVELRLPTVFLIDAQGEVVKVYRDGVDASQIVKDAAHTTATPAERLARALPFQGRFETPPAERNYFQYSLDLAEQGYETTALAGFERAAKLDPNAITFYNLGTLRMKAGRAPEAKAAFEQALALDPKYPEANNSLGALLAQSGDVPAAVARFRTALETRPEFPDALNNLGYALFQSEREQEAYTLYQKALELQPDFPEAFNNLGIFYGQQGDLDKAESFFRRALEKRSGYGEAANNLALVLAARGDVAGAVEVLKRLLAEDPGFEMAYVTLCRVHLENGHRREATQALEQLLQRNPKHPLGLQLLQQLKAGG